MSTIAYKPLSALKLTLWVMLVTSLLFPVLFAYINSEMNWGVIGRELLLTPLRLVGITLIVFLIIQLANRLLAFQQFSWVRYILEFPIIGFLVYYWMIWTLQHVELPMRNMDGFFSTSDWNFRQYISIFLVGSLFIYIFQSGLNIYRLAQQKAAEVEQYEKDNALAGLQALKNQVNPHFLFNSLSVLSSLVHVSAETSEKFIHQLSKAYRYILDQKDLQYVSLKAELDFLDAYYFLLQIRFDQKIKLHNAIDADVEAFALPPLTLQLLLENVVKHNKMSNQEPLIIHLFTTGDYLVVENNINKRSGGEGSTGIGLDNIRKRYGYLTAKPIEIIENETNFTVRLPLIKINAKS